MMRKPATDRASKTDQTLHHLAAAARDEQRREQEYGASWDRQADAILAEHGAADFGSDFQNEIARNVRQQLGSGAGTPTAGLGNGSVDERGNEHGDSEGNGAKPLPSPLEWRPHLALAAILLIAVGVLHTLTPSPYEGAGGAASVSSGIDSPSPDIDPLPVFVLVELVATETLRSENPEPATDLAVEVVPGQRFRVLVQPRSTARGAVGLRIFVEDSEGRVERWLAGEARAVIGAEGVIEIEAPELEAWQSLAPGEYTLHFAIARPADLPEAADLLEAISPRSENPATWQLLSAPIRLAAS